MTIRYPSGRIIEAVLLQQTDSHLRVIAKGDDEILDFTRVRTTWISEECDPVEIRFAWERNAPPLDSSEADFICSPELASRLIHLLWNGDDPDCCGSWAPAQLEKDNLSCPHLIV